MRQDLGVDGRGIKTVYVYDSRDRITKVSSTNMTVTYDYDGDVNLKQRSDATGVNKYVFDPLSRETIRTLQDGSQTVLTYYAEGNVESYKDPSGTVKYTYNKVIELESLTDAQGKKTGYEYNAYGFRTKTSFPGGTVETITPDKGNRAERIKATSSAGTLVDLAYDYAYTSGGTTKDGTQIRTETDAVAGLERAYTYDSAGRLTFTNETKGSTVNHSWLHCYDKAGNETAGAPTVETARTGGQWNDFSQLTSRRRVQLLHRHDRDGRLRHRWSGCGRCAVQPRLWVGPEPRRVLVDDLAAHGVGALVASRGSSAPRSTGGGPTGTFPRESP